MSDRMLTDGSPVPQDRSHTEIDPTTGQQRGYVVLTPEERAKGFVKPVRRSYLHRKCGSVTTMGRSLAETYARDPNFYNGTFCCHCHEHFGLEQFEWEDGEPMLVSRQEAWVEEQRQIKNERRLARIAELRRELAELEKDAT